MTPDEIAAALRPTTTALLRMAIRIRHITERMEMDRRHAAELAALTPPATR